MSWAGPYYEVVFAPTGQAYLNKFIQGQLTQVATAAKQVARAIHVDRFVERVVLTCLVEIGDEDDARDLRADLLTHSAQCEFDGRRIGKVGVNSPAPKSDSSTHSTSTITFLPIICPLRRSEPDLDDLRRHLAPFYSPIGRPSIDPELMIRMMIVGYCFGPQESAVPTSRPRRKCREACSQEHS